MYALNLSDDNRILSVGKKVEGVDYGNMVMVNTLPEGDPTDYKYINNEYIYDPSPKPKLEEEQPTQLDILEAQVTYTAMMTDTLLGV